MEFGSTLCVLHIKMLRGFRLEMRFRITTMTLIQVHFCSYVNNTTSNPTTNFTDSSNAFYNA